MFVYIHFNAVEDHCLKAIKIVHHHANGRFYWLIFGYQSVNPLREVISILSGKYKRFTFVHSVHRDIVYLISLQPKPIYHQLENFKRIEKKIGNDWINPLIGFD